MIFINTTGTYLKIPEVLFMDDSDKKNHNGFYASLYIYITNTFEDQT